VTAPSGSVAAPPGLHLALSVTNFAQGLAAFSAIGIVGLVASDLGVPIHDAGRLISFYSIVYAIASPLLVALTGALDRRTVLAAGLAVLAAAALGASVAPAFPALLLARCAMALGGSVTTPIAASIGVATSEPARRGRVLALVFAGLALSQAAGVPLSAWLAGAFSWRAAMVAIGCTALLALGGVALKVPRAIPVAVPRPAALLTVLRTPHLLAALSFIVFYLGCNFSLLTYLAPYLVERFGLEPREVAGCLLLYGCAAFAGSGLGGWLTDRLGPGRALVLLASIMAAALPMLTLASLPLPAFLVLLMGWGTFGWSVHVPQQARLAHLDPARAPVLLALHSSGIYLGVTAGATVAGSVIDAAGARWIGPAGAVLALGALASLAVTRAFAARRGRQTPRPASG
jgi:predicted MFS family arabinose efflux permease